MHTTPQRLTLICCGGKPKTKKGNWGGFEMQTTRDTEYEIVKN